MSNKIVLLLFLIFPFLFSFSPQESKVNQRKIERQQKKKERESEKQYKKAKKDHVKKQSKETRSMMKNSKKESKKNTPVKAPKGKKCE